MQEPITLATEFERIRRSAGVTLREIGHRCDLHETTIGKITRDLPTRWETIHLALAIGLRCRPGTRDYENMHRLWIEQRNRIGETAAPRKGCKPYSLEAVHVMKEFREIIRGLDSKGLQKVLAAAKRVAGKMGMNA